MLSDCDSRALTQHTCTAKQTQHKAWAMMSMGLLSQTVVMLHHRNATPASAAHSICPAADAVLGALHVLLMPRTQLPSATPSTWIHPNIMSTNPPGTPQLHLYLTNHTAAPMCEAAHPPPPPMPPQASCSIHTCSQGGCQRPAAGRLVLVCSLLPLLLPLRGSPPCCYPPLLRRRPLCLFGGALVGLVLAFLLAETCSSRSCTLGQYCWGGT